MEEKRAQERRYRRTEAMISNGLVTLLQKKSINKITVRELSDLADINRSTFYLHYTDIYDLLEKTERRLLKQLTEAADDEWKDEFSPEHFFRFLEQVFVILSENAPLCAALMGSNGDIAFLRTIEDLVRVRGMHTLHSFAPEGLSEHDLQYSATYALSGCVGLVGQWLNEGCPETPTHMAELSILLLQEGMSSIRLLNKDDKADDDLK